MEEKKKPRNKTNKKKPMSLGNLSEPIRRHFLTPFSACVLPCIVGLKGRVVECVELPWCDRWVNKRSLVCRWSLTCS